MLAGFLPLVNLTNQPANNVRRKVISRHKHAMAIRLAEFV